MPRIWPSDLGIRFETIPIDAVFQAYLDTLAPIFEGTEPGVAEENLQARIRGAILMAISNKFGPMVLATGNKSEMAAGYATIYGDMVGGYSVLKDIFKTTVYRLAAWRNSISDVIPARARSPNRHRPSCARIRRTLTAFLPTTSSIRSFVYTSKRIEGSRRSSPPGTIPTPCGALPDWSIATNTRGGRRRPGVKITTKSFGRDRRLPITNGYR